MKYSFIEAVEILKTGDEDRAWAMALTDEGLMDHVTKEMWLNFAYRSEAFMETDHGRA